MTDTALDRLRARCADQPPRIAVVLGSGWGGLTARLQDAERIPYAELPGFPVSTVAGHDGALWLGRLGAHRLAVMSGRKHVYETGEADGMKLPLRTLRALGCEVLVQTNAAGSLRPVMTPGSLMAISDHLNLSQRSPLVGEAGSERFVSMVDAYDPALRQHARTIAQSLGTPLHEGVFAWFLGPQFETPAEIRMLRAFGAQAVGMSTVPETIIARHAGLKVLALSMMTNMAAGMEDEVLSHAHTLATANAASQRAVATLAAVVQALKP